MSVVFEAKGDFAVIRLGNSTEKVVKLDADRLEALEEALTRVDEHKGLILVGAQAESFCVGADISVIKSVSDPSEGAKLARRGQEVFDKIESLKVPTVAVVGGPCVGGGCEMILACDYRVASDHPKTSIGLPEVQLGILPGFGGTQRLPRLIGLPAALDIILNGKKLVAKKAHKVGLVDRLSSFDSVDSAIEAGEQFLLDLETFSRPSISFRDKMLTKVGFGRNLAASQARKLVLKKTKGHYPAPLKALDVTVRGLSMSRAKGMELEAEALGELIVTPECKSLVHVFFLTEDASKLGRTHSAEIKDQAVAVIGAGTMGAGIAGAFLVSGFNVSVIDISEDVREKARKHITDYINSRRSVDNSVLDNLHFADDISKAPKPGLVIEAVNEDLNLKKKILTSVSSAVSGDCIISTNTSSLAIDDCATGVRGPTRVIGMHFFNPAERMPLVELVRAKRTSDETVLKTSAYTSALRKYPIVVESCPGFLVNRVLSPYLMEAAHLLSEGYTVRQIDKAALDFGMPMGPLRLLDEVGLDVASKVAEIVEAGYGKRMSGPAYTGKLVSQGKLGRKTRSGFYQYFEDGSKEVPTENLKELLGISQSSPIESLSPDEISDRLILTMVNEAIRSLDEGVAGATGPEAAAQIDLGTVMGLGFAPFRGGVVHYAESLGAKVLFEKLSKFRSRHGVRYEPAPGIKARADVEASFYDRPVG